MWVVTLGGLVGPGAVACADAIFVDDQRSLFVRNDTCSDPCPVELTKVPLFPTFPFDDIISGIPFNDWSSSQSSTVAGDSMTGVGYTDSFTSLGEGRSRFDVTFSIGEEHGFVLTGAIEAEGNAGALAQLTDEGTATPLFFYLAGPLAGGPLSQPMDEMGVLPPGLYRLQVEGVVLPDGVQGGDADWSFTLALPEPAVGRQLLAGIVALAALGRSRRPTAAVS